MAVFLLFFLFCSSLFAEDLIPLQKETQWYKMPSVSYRPALNYKNVPLEDTSSPNKMSSPSLTIEAPNTGRFGSVRLDGSGTKPSFSVDGFLFKDSAINEGQLLLDMLPIDFAESVDIYKQNLYPIGITSGSLIDFRLGRGEKYISLYTKAGTLGNWYTKVQGEELFEGGSTVYGITTDFLFKDYYYAAPEGGFKTSDNSTYQRAAMLVKTVYKDWQFLISDVYMRSYDETGTGLMNRNNLMTGLRWRKGVAYAQASYNFTSLHIGYEGGATNHYLGQFLTLSSGAEARTGRWRWHAGGAYTYNSITDAPNAPQKNYLNVPGAGDNAFNVVAEGGISIYKEEDYKPVNAEFAVSVNQIISTIYGYEVVPSFTMAVRSRKGVYLTADISRVYIPPDLTTYYGFGLQPGTRVDHLLPKDGLRTGGEIGYASAYGRLYLQGAYSWFDTSFRVVNYSNVINVSKVQGLNVELGGDAKFPTGSSALTELAGGLAFNNEVDSKNTRSPLTPMVKMVSSLGWREVNNLWSLKMHYTLHWNISSGGDSVDLTVRHFLDLTAHWRWFSIGLLNILNQSYRPDPYNTLSAYNPGFRAEFGIKYEWK